MMTILGLFLNTQIRTGGHRRYLELMEELAQRGNKVYVLLNEVLDYAPSHFIPVPIRARYVRGGFPPASWVFRKAVKTEMRKIAYSVSDPDWLLIHGETHLGAARCLKRYFHAKLLFASRSNVVQWTRISMIENRKKPKECVRSFAEHLNYRYYEHLAAASADVLSFQSAFDRDDFLSRVPNVRHKTCIIGGNIGEPRFKPENKAINESDALRKLLFVGTLGERKGLRYLLEAVSILAERGIADLELDVLGPGEDLPAHLDFVRNAGIAERVRFHGRVSDPFPYYKAGDLLVVPSLFDSYPDTVLEAIHTGIPVIAARTGGIPDQLRHDELLFPIRDARAIADMIEPMYRDADRYRKIRSLCEGLRPSFDFNWAEAWEEAMRGAQS